MLLSLFLVMLAQAATPQTAPGNAPADLPAAIQLAESGRNADALAALQRIAAANPGDHQTRLWIARVHDRMGHPQLAEIVYRSVSLEDPRNVDALVGMGVTLLEQDQVEAAIDALERAEQLASQNPNVLTALAEAYRRDGRSERSMAYFERVEAISPTPAHLTSLERARREHGHRFESQTYGEDFNGNTATTRGEDLGVNVRLSEAFRVTGRGQFQTKFGRRENRAGGGAQWRAVPEITLTGQALVGGNGNRVLPQKDYLGQVDYTYHRATWTAAIRYFDFFGANVVMASPGVTIVWSPTWTFGLRYALTSTDTSTATGIQGHTLQLRGAHEIRPRVWVHGGYTRGVENFDNFSSDRIGAFHAHTGTAAVQVLLPSLTSIVGGYDYQRRENGVTMGRINISLVQSF